MYRVPIEEQRRKLQIRLSRYKDTYYKRPEVITHICKRSAEYYKIHGIRYRGKNKERRNTPENIVKRKLARTTPRAKQQHKEWHKNKLKTDPHFRFAVMVRCRLRQALKIANAKKQNKTTELLGCSLPQLREYLEERFKSGMHWNNHTLYGWHIDHIVPCSLFDLTYVKQQKACFHYTNLQPLWYTENLSKNNSLPSLSALPTNSPAYPYLIKFIEDKNYNLKK